MGCADNSEPQEESGVPISADDDLDPGVEAAIDIRSCTAARAPGDRTWISCEIEGAWSPPDSLYSWYVRTTIFSPGQEARIGECLFQRRDGVAETFCDHEDYEGFTSTPTAMGFLVVFDDVVAAEGATLEINTGVQLTQSGDTATDMLNATFGADLVPVPLVP